MWDRRPRLWSCDVRIEATIEKSRRGDFVSSEIAVAMESCGNWVVKSAVDATNGFGAVIRTRFAAEVRRSSIGDWTTKVYFDK